MDAKLTLAKCGMSVGVIGFVAGWAIGWTTEARVFSNSAFLERTAERNVEIRVKGSSYFLEPDAARAFEYSQTVMPYSFMISLLGGAYLERRKRQANRLLISGLAEPEGTEGR